MDHQRLSTGMVNKTDMPNLERLGCLDIQSQREEKLQDETLLACTKWVTQPLTLELASCFLSDAFTDPTGQSNSLATMTVLAIPKSLNY